MNVFCHSAPEDYAEEEDHDDTDCNGQDPVVIGSIHLESAEQLQPCEPLSNDGAAQNAAMQYQQSSDRLRLAAKKSNTPSTAK